MLKHLSSRMFPLLALCSLGAVAGLNAQTGSGNDSADPPKNVLLIMSDDLNTRLGAYGDPVVKTPNIDRLAERGVLFERAYCQYPVCNPSRASMLTGLYPDQINVSSLRDKFRDTVPDVVTLPQIFRNAGYFTARSGKIYHQGVPGDIGRDGNDDPASWDRVSNPVGRDKTEEDQIFSFKPGEFGGTLSWRNIEAEDSELTCGMVVDDVIAMMEEKQGEPFFIGAGLYRPHTPFVAPAKYFAMYPLENIPLAEPIAPGAVGSDGNDAYAHKKYDYMFDGVDDELDARRAIQAFFASISFVDAQVGRLLDALDELGLAENTVVIFMSDHGYQLGEHGGLWMKSTLYEDALRTPLIIADPQNATTGNTAGIVELLDLYPTLPVLCGLTAPEGHMGRNLVPQMQNLSHSVREDALSQQFAFYGQGYSLRTDRYRYTEYYDVKEPKSEDDFATVETQWGKRRIELFDHQNDPNEWWNLAEDPQYSQTVEELSARLRDRVVEAGQLPAVGFPVRSFFQWQDKYFCEADRNDPAAAGPEVKGPSGLTNLQRYMLGLTRDEPYRGFGKVFQSTEESQALRFEISYNKEADDPPVYIELSPDLRRWSRDPLWRTLHPLTRLEDKSSVEVRLTSQAPTSEAFFLRISSDSQ